MADNLSATLDRELKKGSAELLVLSLLESRQRHGYEISKQIEHESGGVLSFNVASLYPLLYRLEKQRWIRGTWETSRNGRRRRCYRLTPTGKKKLSPLRKQWSELFVALNRLGGVSNA